MRAWKQSGVQLTSAGRAGAHSALRRAAELVACFASGTSLVMLLMVRCDAGDTAVLILLFPGAFCMKVAGYGGHDILGFAMYILVNVVFYSVAVFFIQKIAVFAWSRVFGRSIDRT